MRSIELSWLNRHDKDIRLPQLLYRASPVGGAGCCYCPSDTPLMLDGEVIDRSTGVIFIDPSDGIYTQATLAHEWRHLWQAYNAPIYHTIQWRDVDYEGYQKAIIAFFQQRHEADALRYELKHAPNHVNRSWAGWLGWTIRERAFSFPR